MIQVGVVRFKLKDLVCYWPTEFGFLGGKVVEGYFIALQLRGAPELVRTGFENDVDRDSMLRKLDLITKRKVVTRR